MQMIEILFFIIAAYIILCMFLSITVTKVMSSAFWLIMMLAGVGVLFLLANSEIVFFIQVSVYGGGIAVLLLFSILLTEHDERVFPEGMSDFLRATWSQIIIFLLLLVNIVYLLVATVRDGSYKAALNGELGDTKIPVHSTGDKVGAFDRTLNFTDYLWGHFGNVLPFIGMLFLAAVLGAVKVVIREWEIEELKPGVKQHIMDQMEAET